MERGFYRNSIAFDFAVQGLGLDAEQSGGSSLTSSGVQQCAFDESGFKLANLFKKIHSILNFQTVIRFDRYQVVPEKQRRLP